MSSDKHRNGCQARLKERNKQHLNAAFFQCRKTEKLARAECNERQGDVCNEIHPLDKTYRDQV